jgi:GAG-pre-integrase domain
VAAREEPSEGERKGFSEMDSHSSSQTDSDRLNRLESMLATLLNQRTNTQSGTIYCHNKTEKLIDKLIHNPTNCTKNSSYFNTCLTIGPSTINVLSNCTQWVLDSDATDHMMGNQNMLTNYRKINSYQFFTVANNEKIKIEEWGMVSIFPKRFIQDVFYVNNYSINLLSISKLSKDLNCEIIFKMKSIIFQDLLTKEKIDEGYLENGLYFFSTNKLIFNTRKNEILCELWHKRVGHPSDKIFKFIFDFSKDYCTKCEVCSLSKHIIFFL